MAKPRNHTICWRPLKLLMMAAVVIPARAPEESGANEAMERAMVELVMTAG